MQLEFSARPAEKDVESSEESVMIIVPVQVTFRGLAHSPSLEAAVRERVAWLEQFCAGIIHCRAVVEIRHRRRHEGRQVHVRLEFKMADTDPIVVSHEPSLHGRLKDLEERAHDKDADIDGVHRYAKVTIHEAFDVARRRLEDFVRV
jgi:hypothetical protein